jgi:carbamoyl-phosphate synthase large subunit
LGSLKVNSLHELRNWIQINPGVEKFLASEYLPGRNLACKMLYYKGELIRSAVAERVNYIMAKISPSGITGNSSFGRLINDTHVFEVANQAMDIMFEKSQSSKHGFFTVDLKEDENRIPKVTEVNVRHVAFTQCFAAGGANLAEDMIRLLDKDESFDKNFKLYEFEPDLIFLRDVDEIPIMMHESQLLK